MDFGKMDWSLIAVVLGGVFFLVSVIATAWKWYRRLLSRGEGEPLQDRLDKIARED